MDGSASFSRCQYELGTLVQVLRGQDVVIPLRDRDDLSFVFRSTPRDASGIKSGLGK